MKNKSYVSVGSDAGGIKFYIGDIMFRPAGNPLIILEYLYRGRGGESFMSEYRKGKDASDLLKQCVIDTNEFLYAMKVAADNNKSPFVVYNQG